jgi:Ca2+-binding EF-hand superfamily protein
MPRLISVALALAVCLVAPTYAMAQSGMGSFANAVRSLDKNFDAADKNHDGLLSKQEAQDAHLDLITKNFEAIDVQHRGLVSKQEVHDFIGRSLAQHPAPATSAPHNP